MVVEGEVEEQWLNWRSFDFPVVVNDDEQYQNFGPVMASTQVVCSHGQHWTMITVND